MLFPCLVDTMRTSTLGISWGHLRETACSLPYVSGDTFTKVYLIIIAFHYALSSLHLILSRASICFNFHKLRDNSWLNRSSGLWKHEPYRISIIYMHVEWHICIYYVNNETRDRHWR